MSKILIIDDDHGVCRTLEALVQQNGHEAVSAHTLDDGMMLADREAVDLVFLDVHLPDGNGLEEIPRISRAHTRPEIVIMTGMSDPDGAELAIESGAWDYIPKSASPKAMTLSLLRVLEYRTAKKGRQTPPAVDRRGIIGESRALSRALDQVADTMGSDAGVLITGETGTGKELFAQAVHRNSTRRDSSFVVVDCASLPKTLVESMLFGHVRGAFTGADTAREGLIRQADGGTLFLDEVGEMPLELQKAFLRVLETHRFRPIGEKRETASDFRVVSSTNRDLEEMVEQGLFRKDLLYRLRTFHLHLPPLRDRIEDIPALARHHGHRLNTLYGWPEKPLTQGFLDLLNAYEWPGNVRELVNIMDCAVTAAQQDPQLFACHVPRQVRATLAKARLPHRAPVSAEVLDTPDAEVDFPPLQYFRETVVDNAESNYLTALMSAADGNMIKACSLSGVSRSRLYELLKKHAIGN